MDQPSAYSSRQADCTFVAYSLNLARVLGIGLEIALQFLRKGDQVVLTSRSIEVESLSASKEEMVRYVYQGRGILLKADIKSVRFGKHADVVFMNLPAQYMSAGLDCLVKVGMPD